MENQMDYLLWDCKTIDDLITNEKLDNNKKMDLLEKYIKWKLANSNALVENTYPTVNLMLGHYNLGLEKSSTQINEIIKKDYGNEFSNVISSITNEQIMSGLLVGSLIYKLIN